MKTAIVTICMDRLAQLVETLPTWRSANLPIYCLDWSSPIPLQVEGIIIGRVDGKEFFNPSKARNAAVRLVQRLDPAVDRLLMVDCDVTIESSLLILPEVCAWRGLPSGTGGSCLMPVAAWKAAGGWNEFMEGYGGECGEFYSRVIASGTAVRLIKTGMTHIQHPDELRTHHFADSRDVSKAKNAEVARSKAWKGDMEKQTITFSLNGAMITEEL